MMLKEKEVDAQLVVLGINTLVEMKEA
jgi:hypothetical protein